MHFERSVQRLAAVVSHSEVLLVVFLPWFLLPPEVAPPAPLQTQDGSAVAIKNTRTQRLQFALLQGVSVGCGWFRKQTPPSHCFNQHKQKNKKNNFYLCKDDPAAPSKRADGFQFDTSQHHRDPGREGGGLGSALPTPPSTALPPVGGSRNYSSHFFFCASATSLICEKQEKKMERENIFILLYRRDT